MNPGPSPEASGSSRADSPTDSLTASLRGSLAGPDRLVTNEYAHWNPHAHDAVHSPAWDVSSGSLFVRDGVGWSGPATLGPVDAASRSQTNSGVFRATLRGPAPRAGTVSGRFRIVPDGLASGVASGAGSAAASGGSHGPGDEDWYGMHLWVRYRSPRDLVSVSISRHDGTVAIKRKTPGGPVNGGTYATLAQARGGLAPGGWHDVAVTFGDDPGGATAVTLSIDGRQALAASVPTAAAESGDEGTVGVRADRTEFEMTDLAVTPR